VKKVNPKAPQLAPTPEYRGSKAEEIRYWPTRLNGLPFLSRDFIEKHHLDPTGTEPAHEHVVLVKQGDRLEPGPIDSHGQIEQRLIRAPDRSILIGLYDQNARWPWFAIGRGRRVRSRCFSSG
jgi:hypothetical protein